MEPITKEAIDFVAEKLNEMVDEGLIEERYEMIIRYKYGIGVAPLKPKDMAKTLKITMKKLKQEMKIADKKVFNILKKQIQ